MRQIFLRHRATTRSVAKTSDAPPIDQRPRWGFRAKLSRWYPAPKPRAGTGRSGQTRSTPSRLDNSLVSVRYETTGHSDSSVKCLPCPSISFESS